MITFRSLQLYRIIFEICSVIAFAATIIVLNDINTAPTAGLKQSQVVQGPAKGMATILYPAPTKDFGSFYVVFVWLNLRTLKYL